MLSCLPLASVPAHVWVNAWVKAVLAGRVEQEFWHGSNSKRKGF